MQSQSPNARTCIVVMPVIERAPLQRLAPGEYENEWWYVKREAEDDSADYAFKATAIHPVTGREYVPAPVFSWFVYDKRTGDLHDAYPTLREARRYAEYAR